MNPASV